MDFPPTGGGLDCGAIDEGTSWPGRKYVAAVAANLDGAGASYVSIRGPDAKVSKENATGSRKMGAAGGGVSSSSMGGTTMSPSSEFGENERLYACSAHQ